MPLRLSRLQLGLAGLAAALFLGAIVVLLLPPAGASAALPEAPAELPEARFEAPLYALANEPETPLVDSNPFDPARRPPDRRWSAAAAADPVPLLSPPSNPGFALLGTVLVPGGRDIAVLRVLPAHPGGAAFHVGDEPLPGWRVTRIGRDEATLAGEGQRLDLELTDPSPGGLP